MKIYTLIPMLCLFMAAQSFAQPNNSDKKVFITNESTINSDGLEYSPAFLESGIVFISTKPTAKRYKIKDKRIDKNIMSIFQAEREDNGLLKKPEPFAIELLSTVHEGPVTFDRTADNIFFTRNNVKNGKLKKAKDGIVKLKIYSAERVGKEWKNIEELPFNDDNSNTVHPSISVEGDALYFASDRPGGVGGLDIYVAYQRGGVWSEPENLGPGINTDGDEVFPYIHADGTLYFASSGHAGFGGLDIFTATNVGGTWSSPVNLSTPFNSENDDFGFILDRDKKNGYLSSNRPGGLGNDDIYSFYVFDGLDDALGVKPVVVKTMTFLVSDLESGAMLDSARISYTDIDNLTFSNAINAIQQEQGVDGENLVLRLPMDNTSLSGLTDSFGKFPLSLEGGNYVVIIEKEGFESQQIIVNSESEEGEIFIALDKAKPIDETLADLGTGDPSDSSGNNENGMSDLGSEDGFDDGVGIENVDDAFPSTIREGTVFQLSNIYYNFNDASIRPDARIDLDALAAFLNNYPDIEIELASHTDSRGGTRYNRQLSQKRAESAVGYLIDRGVNTSRLRAVGYGESELRNRCSDGVNCSEVEHQYNRRTEVRITKMDQEINIRFTTDTSAPASASESSNNYGPTYESQSSNTSEPSYSSSSDSGAAFQVVAGVFKNYDNAEKRYNKLQSYGYAPEIVNGGDTYTILVGVYYSLQEAQGVVQTLKSDYEIRSFVKR